MGSVSAPAEGGLAQAVAASALPPPKERRRIRRAANATLREFAAELGVDPMTVLRWERGDVVPRREHAIKYRRLLDALEQVIS